MWANLVLGLADKEVRSHMTIIQPNVEKKWVRTTDVIFIMNINKSFALIHEEMSLLVVLFTNSGYLTRKKEQRLDGCLDYVKCIFTDLGFKRNVYSTDQRVRALHDLIDRVNSQL
jgi:hypothetical protein